MQDKVPENAVLFVTGRASQGGRMPVLVAKYQVTEFPVEFELTPRELMMQGMPIPEAFEIDVRLDQDGDAISRTPGDLQGAAHNVSAGSEDLSITLDKTITEAKAGRPIQ
ncbi:MAG: hypothetical protein R3C68_13960 [Myxococcota bacterium]